ncbi:uncharacterized protein LOC129796466 [Lutzomyia longipalpis]|uniref:uncharacterized protein LOC129796466 n=1 Tax=Lutzomyia longipalpis TaxID=7200 RepID=UPI002483E54A|nr:uncharacterized protein LOC129796466 [Lutzomyia longipalpis]
MRVKILLSSVLVLLVIDSALGCLCLRNRGMCNCLPRARLWRPRPRNIVAVIQPLPQDQLVNPNICRCGRPLLRPINPILPPDFSDSLQDFNQPAFGARCLCTKQPEDIDCLPSNDLPTTIPWSPQILPNRPMLHPRLAPEILPPADLLPGTPFWTVNEEGNLQLTPGNIAPYDTLPPLNDLPEDDCEEEKIEQDENVFQYLNQLFKSGAENIFGQLNYQ